jgi:hypothetical protein
VRRSRRCRVRVRTLLRLRPSLRGIMTSLLKPTAGAEKALAEMGLSSEGLREQIQEEGLLSVLETLTDAFADNEQGAEDVFGNVRALSGVMDLMGSNVEGTRADLCEHGRHDGNP